MQPVVRAQAEDPEEAVARGAVLVQVGAALALEVVLAVVQDPVVGLAPAGGLAALVPEAALVLAPARAAAQAPVAAAAPDLSRAAAVARVPAAQAVVAGVEEARAQCTVELTAASVTAGSTRARIPNPRPHLRAPRTVIKRVELTKTRLRKFLGNGAGN
jgi:hypothetical protein